MNTETKQLSVGIVGRGFVGKILQRYYPSAFSYDPLDGKHPLELVLTQDVVFIAFNLKDNALSEDSYQQVAFYPKTAPVGRVFVIKSTFVPGTTDRLQNEFPKHRFIYNPEFLTEMTAWEDFTRPIFQVLGCPHQSLDLAEAVFGILPDAPIKRVISPRDAEVLKHAINSYFALKVTWFNQLYDASQKIGSDYETVREIMVRHPWIGDSHSVVFHKGYRGYGGKCLSKDPKNFLAVVDIPLIRYSEEYNAKLLASQKM